MLAVEHPPSKTTDWVAHTIRLPKTLNERMLYQSRRRYGGNVQAFIMALVVQAVELPDPPDCATCGFRHLGEFVIESLRADGPYKKRPDR